MQKKWAGTQRFLQYCMYIGVQNFVLKGSRDEQTEMGLSLLRLEERMVDSQLILS